jgi:hypothetical protein
MASKVPQSSNGTTSHIGTDGKVEHIGDDGNGNDEGSNGWHGSRESLFVLAVFGVYLCHLSFSFMQERMYGATEWHRSIWY